MELVPTVIWLPPHGSAGRLEKVMIPRVHAGEGLVMVIGEEGRYMTVTSVTISARRLTDNDWEQWVYVSFDDE